MAVNGGAGDDGPPLTELESLQLKANQVTDDSLESTRRMIQLCEDVSLSDHSFDQSTVGFYNQLTCGRCGLHYPDYCHLGWVFCYLISLSPAISLLFTAFIQSKEAGIKTLVALDDQGGKCVL